MMPTTRGKFLCSAAFLLATVSAAQAQETNSSTQGTPGIAEAGSQGDSGTSLVDEARSWIGQTVVSVDGTQLGTLTDVTEVVSDSSEAGQLVVEAADGTTMEVELQGATSDGETVTTVEPARTYEEEETNSTPSEPADPSGTDQSSAGEAMEVEATLAGHAILPADTRVAPPEDAPESLEVSGKFTAEGNPGRQTDAPSEGAALPMQGQPVQGFSGISMREDGTFYVLTDNGFGSKQNSPDAMLFFHVVQPDFETGDVEIERTIFLSDPNKVVPFPIQMEGTAERYLTGADFDTEGFQVIDGKIYIGEEFGPYIFVADAETGEVEAFYETFVEGTRVQSPDNFRLQLPNPDEEKPAYNLKRSRGFEGLAASPDGATLYPMLEGPIYDDQAGDYERHDGNEALRILEFDVAEREWTGRSMLYRLEQDGNAIGDFNMIDDTRALVIERDNNQGTQAQACEAGQTEGCFESPAEFKRVYLIDMAGVGDGEPVKKLAYINLLDIADPNGIARQGAQEDGRFAFPFQTIENVDQVDDAHIIVADDNNFPFSRGRSVDEPDDNEFILLEVAEFLKTGTN